MDASTMTPERAAEIVAANFLQRDGPMDRLAAEWLKTVLRDGRRIDIEWYQGEEEPLPRLHQTESSYDPGDYYDVDEFLDEPSSMTLIDDERSYRTWGHELSDYSWDCVQEWLRKEGLDSALKRRPDDAEIDKELRTTFGDALWNATWKEAGWQTRFADRQLGEFVSVSGGGPAARMETDRAKHLKPWSPEAGAIIEFVNVPWEAILESAFFDARESGHNAYEQRCPHCRTVFRRLEIKDGAVTDVTTWPGTEHEGDYCLHDSDALTLPVGENGDYGRFIPALWWCRECHGCGESFGLVEIEILDQEVELCMCDSGDIENLTHFEDLTLTSDEGDERVTWLAYRGYGECEGERVGVEGHILGPFPIELGGENRCPYRQYWDIGDVLVTHVVDTRNAPHRMSLDLGQDNPA